MEESKVTMGRGNGHRTGAFTLADLAGLQISVEGFNVPRRYGQNRASTEACAKVLNPGMFLLAA